MMNSKNPYLVSVAILAGGIILALAIFVTRSAGGPSPAPGDVSRILPVTSEDHIVGTPTAPVIVVEYSDIDCQYCKSFQATMAQIMTEYGADGKVAWVFRHFPIVSLHQYSAQHAEAAECVAKQGGNDAFFRFIDALHQQAPGGSLFDPRNYGAVLTTLSLSPTEFESCMDADTEVARVTRDLENALAIGANGTPYSVIFIKGHDPVPLSGYLPYDDMKEVIDEALAKAAGN